ncbi:MAG: hypothetical protein ACR2LT_00240 [Pyrinomonadaceae bacterium]
MKNTIIIFIFLLVGFSNLKTLSQDVENPTNKSFDINKGESLEKIRKSKIDERKPFRSPFRYIIISSVSSEELGLDIPQLWIEILMDKKSFNEKNLRLLFSMLSKRFTTPIRLNIKVHTNLATIETPEEEEIMSSHDQLEEKENYYKTASYSRFNEGGEVFEYAYGKPPGFWWKTIVLNKSK